MDKLLKVYTLFFLSWVDGGCCLSFFSFLFFASPKKRNKRKATFVESRPRDKRGSTLGAQSFYHQHGAGF